MTEPTTTYVIGMDLSDRTADFYGAERATGSLWRQGKVQLSRVALRATFGDVPRSSFVIEIGSHSRWVRRELEEMGHEVTISDARKLRFIFSSKHKTDALDARALCDVALLRPSLLHPIDLRTDDVHRDLILVRARDSAVRARTQLINTVRGVLKPLGVRIACSDTSWFVESVEDQVDLPERRLVAPLLASIKALTMTIERYEAKMARLAEKKYPETEILRQVHGVGPTTALTFLLTLGSWRRFSKSRDVGAYVGLTPGLWQSGTLAITRGITKAGNPLLRRLLVQCAHATLRKNAPDSDLKRFGLSIAHNGGKQDKGARRRAVVAVARKLSVLLHALWRTGEVYEPLRNHSQAA